MNNSRCDSKASQFINFNSSQTKQIPFKMGRKCTQIFYCSSTYMWPLQNIMTTPYWTFQCFLKHTHQVLCQHLVTISYSKETLDQNCPLTTGSAYRLYMGNFRKKNQIFICFLKCIIICHHCLHAVEGLNTPI